MIDICKKVLLVIGNELCEMKGFGEESFVGLGRR